MATRCSWSSTANAINATLYEKLNFDFIRDIAPVAGISATPLVHGGQSVVSGQDSRRVHRLREGQSGQDQHGLGWQRDPVTGRRALQDDDRHRHGARALSRLGARTDRSARRAGAGLFSPLPSSLEYVKAGKLRRSRNHCGARAALPDIPTVGEFVPGYEATAWYGIGAPRNTPAEIIDKLNKEINAGLADPTIKARLAELGGRACRLARRVR